MSLYSSCKPIFGHQVWKRGSPFSCPKEYCSRHFWHPGHFLQKDHWHSYYSAGKNMNRDLQGGSVPDTRLPQVCHICLGYRTRVILFFCLFCTQRHLSPGTDTDFLINLHPKYPLLHLFHWGKKPTCSQVHVNTCTIPFHERKHMPVQTTHILLGQDGPLQFGCFSDLMLLTSYL